MLKLIKRMSFAETTGMEIKMAVIQVQARSAIMKMLMG